MTTFLGKEDYCGWCGKDGAKQTCACGRINYCGATCQKAAWSEHKLVCSKAKDTSSHVFSVGDIVKISGLGSEAGKKMNDQLAEVYQPLNKETGRVMVLLTTDDFKIKSASIKRGNLEVHLSTRQAAVQAAKAEKGLRGKLETPEQEKVIMKKSEKLNKTIRSFTGAAIVKRIRDGDRIMLNAAQLPIPSKSVSNRQVFEMFDSGLTEVVLEKFKFPESIDANVEWKCPPDKYLSLLGNMLTGYEGDSPRLQELRLDTMRKLGPVLLVCASKKRRFQGLPERWWMLQGAMINLLANATNGIPGQPITGDAIKAMQNELDPVVMTKLLEYMVSTYTVDPKLYLRAKTPMFPKNHDLDHVHFIMKVLIGRLLCELSNDRIVGEDTVLRFGSTLVPGGAPGLTGRMFASCFLDCAAKLALQLEVYPSDPKFRVQELLWIYRGFLNCRKTQVITGPFDVAFSKLNSRDKFIEWAKARIEKEKKRESPDTNLASKSSPG